MVKVKHSQIKTVFMNLLFLIGVILSIIGFIRATSTVTKLIVFDEYPLNSYEETKCDYPNYPERVPVVGETGAVMPDTSSNEKSIKSCKESLTRERKVRLVEDITSSISFLAVGLFISFSFRKFIFEKGE